MRRETFAKLALGCAGICACGSMAGMGLANYVASGSFAFYRQQQVAEWQPGLSPPSTVVESTDPAFAADRRGTGGGAGAEETFASFDR